MFTMPPISIPELKKTVSLSVSQVNAMSDAELLAVLSGESGHEGIVPIQLQQIITSELLARGLAKGSKPHWSVLPSFWLLVISVALALVGAITALLSLPQVQQHAFGESASQSAASSAEKVK
jgi:Zn-dependent protease with chaperone function